MHLVSVYAGKNAHTEITGTHMLTRRTHILIFIVSSYLFEVISLLHIFYVCDLSAQFPTTNHSFRLHLCVSVRSSLHSHMLTNLNVFGFSGSVQVKSALLLLLLFVLQSRGSIEWERDLYNTGLESCNYLEVLYKVLVIQLRASCTQGESSTKGAPALTPPSYFACGNLHPTFGCWSRGLNCFSCSFFLYGIWTFLVWDPDVNSLSILDWQPWDKGKALLCPCFSSGCFAVLLDYFLQDGAAYLAYSAPREPHYT